jgi:hypothetical protein
MSFPPFNPEQVNAEVARAREAEIQLKAERYAELHGNDDPRPGLFARIRARFRHPDTERSPDRS